MNATRRTPGRGPLAVVGAGLLVSIAAMWTTARPLPEIEQARLNFAELQRQVAVARASQGARTADRGRVLRLRAQARLADDAQRAAFEAEAMALESDLGWGDSAVARSIVLASPLVTRRRAALPTDVVPVFSATRSTCVACHIAVGTPGFENYPRPFRTHPNLSSYVGTSSPHPPSRVECVSCHLGDAHATTFRAAGHSTLRGEGEAVTARAWVDASTNGAMLPVGRTEASCVSCHEGEWYQPGAPALNDAVVTLERGGCYGCHDVPGMSDARKRGPDLSRIKGKLSPEWVRQWLADPTAIKPTTWMPRLWRGQDARKADQRAEIDAVVAYLFGSGDDYSPASADPPPGDGTRGEQLVATLGCLGCHIVDGASREATSLSRTFGQPLQGIGGKTTYAWLFDWVRDPSRYSPNTRMPSLRLSPSEAADVATYLQTLTGTPLSPGASPVGDDAAYRAVLARYGTPPSLTAPGATAPASGVALQVAAGQAVIGALGCFNCHEIRGFEGRTTRVAMGRRPVWTDSSASAIHAVPGTSARVSDLSSTANWDFGPTESARLALGLTFVAGRSRESHGLSTPWQLTNARGRRLVQERNCIGCHVVEGTGGEFLKLVAEPTLGPPLLTPEGARVQPDWLRGFLHRPETIRPWLSVRMPSFALPDDDVERLVAYFRSIAAPNPEPTPVPPGVTASAGKELFETLKCQQCHVLGAIPLDQPTSNLAPDLRTARERLQPEWILTWLRNPSAILPGTRMPTFWPDYPASFYQPLARDGTAQVRAIRDHLMTLH